MVTCSALKWKEVILLKYSHVGLACRIIFKYLPQNSAWPPNSHLNSMSVTKKHKFYISTDFCICLCPFFSVTVSNWKSKLQSKFVRYPKNVFEIVFCTYQFLGFSLLTSQAMSQTLNPTGCFSGQEQQPAINLFGFSVHASSGK